MHDLASASLEVIVGTVTAERTTGVNDSFEFGINVPLVPVTDYNITVTTMVLDGGYGIEAGYWLIVPQIGGTFGHIALNDTGYPALTLGVSYVFFLTDKSPIWGVYNYPLITVGGAQGLFYIQGGKVYSLDNLYPQADGWLPVKANGVPLLEFLTGVQSAYESTVSTTASKSTTSTSTTISTSACSPRSPSNFTTVSETTNYYDVTRQFDSWDWSGTSFQIGGYTVTAVGSPSTPESLYLLPKVSLEVSNGSAVQDATFVNLGAWNGQGWPPDFQQGPVVLFVNEVTATWRFTCDMRVFLEVAIISS